MLSRCWCLEIFLHSLSVCVSAFRVICTLHSHCGFDMLQCLFHFPDHSFIQFLDAKQTLKCLLQQNLNTRTEELCWSGALCDWGGHTWCREMAQDSPTIVAFPWNQRLSTSFLIKKFVGKRWWFGSQGQKQEPRCCSPSKWGNNF